MLFKKPADIKPSEITPPHVYAKRRAELIKGWDREKKSAQELSFEERQLKALGYVN